MHGRKAPDCGLFALCDILTKATIACKTRLNMNSAVCVLAVRFLIKVKVTTIDVPLIINILEQSSLTLTIGEIRKKK